MPKMPKQTSSEVIEIAWLPCCRGNPPRWPSFCPECYQSFPALGDGHRKVVEVQTMSQAIAEVSSPPKAGEGSEKGEPLPSSISGAIHKMEIQMYLEAMTWTVKAKSVIAKGRYGKGHRTRNQTMHLETPVTLWEARFVRPLDDGFLCSEAISFSMPASYRPCCESVLLELVKAARGEQTWITFFHWRFTGKHPRREKKRGDYITDLTIQLEGILGERYAEVVDSILN